MVLGTETWGLKDWLEAASYLVAILAFVGGLIVWIVKRKSPGAAVNRIDIEYPMHGRHGANILARDFESISLKTPVSMRANVPPGQVLRVRLTGAKPEYLDQTEAAWYYKMAPINWTGGQYAESLGETFPVQTFTAEAGAADAEIAFHRRGQVTIQAFENEDREPRWTKQITVTL